MAEWSGARLQPQIDRLWSDLEHLSTFRESGRPGWTRRAFSPEYLAARQWLRERMEQAGLPTSFDAAANLIGRRAGRRDDLDPIMIGSHTDTVDGGGRFDGTVGVLAGIEIARCLEETGTVLDHPLEIVDFLATEPIESGATGMGARQMVPWSRPADLDAQAFQGRSLSEWIEAAGGRPEEIRSEQRAEGSISVYLELHVEQGLTLDSESVPIGIVTELPGESRFRVRLTNPTDAGVVDARQAAIAVDEIRRVLRAIQDDGASDATVTGLKTDPNGPGAVTGGVELWVSIQSFDSTNVDRTWTFQTETQDLAGRLGLICAIDWLGHAPRLKARGRLGTILEEAVTDLGLPSKQLRSPAVHIGNLLSRVCPVGVLLIPSKDGIAHAPDEWTEPEHIRIGTTVLGEALLRLDAKLARRERLAEYREWKLLDRNRNWLGTLVVVGADQPWFICNFEAEPAFEAIRPCFDEARRRLHDPTWVSDDDGLQGWRRLWKLYEPVDALDLRLECEETGEYYTHPFMHINGRRARLRGLPDNFRAARGQPQP